MARGDKDALFNGFHGRLTDSIVLKQRNGKPILCYYPKRDRVKWTENQKNHRVEFKWAARYASYAVNNDDLKAFYRALEHDGINAFNLALADFLHKPEIRGIDIRKARSKDSWLIRVHAVDDFKVTSVKLHLYDLSGQSLELADATQFRNTDRWIFRVSSEKLSMIHTIRAFAEDLPRNKVMSEYVISPEESLARCVAGYPKDTP